jgi:hypothetical protein
MIESTYPDRTLSIQTVPYWIIQLREMMKELDLLARADSADDAVNTEKTSVSRVGAGIRSFNTRETERQRQLSNHNPRAAPARQGRRGPGEVSRQ